MTTKLIKWAAILLLIVGVAWTSFQWGHSRAMEDAAEKRTEAIQKAVEKREAQYRDNLKSVQKQAQSLRERLNQANQVLEKKDQKIEELSDTDKECFDKESLDVFNSY